MTEAIEALRELVALLLADSSHVTRLDLVLLEDEGVAATLARLDVYEQDLMRSVLAALGWTP